MGMTAYSELEERVIDYFNSGRSGEAFNLLKDGESKGDKNATALLAQIYLNGMGVPADIDKAIELFNKAISLGSGEAAYELGLLYDDNDLGIEVDKTKAFDLFQKAESLGNVESYGAIADYLLFGTMGYKDENRAAEYAMKAAKAGIPVGMYDLAVCYDDGLGISRDPYAACHWYKEYLNYFPDNAFSMYRIACCLADPFQVYGIFPTNDDLQEAYYYASQAVEKGNVDAHIIIGWFYEMGNIVPQDFETSHKYIKIAADNGNEFAGELLKRYRKNIYGQYYVPNY